MSLNEYAVTRLRLINVYALFIMCIFVLSWIIVTQHFAVLAILIGMVIGIILFEKPFYCFWTIFFSVFLIGGLITFFSIPTTARWGVALLSLTLGLKIFFDCIVYGSRMQHEPNADKTLLLLLSLFILIPIIGSLLQGVTLQNLVIALKNYFQFAPVTFALALLPHFHKNEFVPKLHVALLTIAILQTIVALYQKFWIGPQFLASGFGTIAVQDAVSGTFSSSLRGGGSGTLSLYLLFCISVLIARLNTRQISWTKATFLIAIIFLPILFNETKASFIYIPVVFIVLFKNETLKSPIKSLFLIVTCIAIITLLGFAYKAIYTNSNQEFQDYISVSIDYNFGKMGHAKYCLNRLSALTFWIEERKFFGITEFLLGHGLDSANEAESAIFGKTGYMATHYHGYGIGLSLAPRLLWETGVVGTVCFFSLLIVSFMHISRSLKAHAVSRPIDIAMLHGLQAAVALCALESFVSPAFRNQEVYNFLFFLIIGLTSLMTRRPNQAG